MPCRQLSCPVLPPPFPQRSGTGCGVPVPHAPPPRAVCSVHRQPPSAARLSLPTVLQAAASGRKRTSTATTLQLDTHDTTMEYTVTTVCASPRAIYLSNHTWLLGAERGGRGRAIIKLIIMTTRHAQKRRRRRWCAARSSSRRCTPLSTLLNELCAARVHTAANTSPPSRSGIHTDRCQVHVAH